MIKKVRWEGEVGITSSKAGKGKRGSLQKLRTFRVDLGKLRHYESEVCNKNFMQVGSEDGRRGILDSGRE